MVTAVTGKQLSELTGLISDEEGMRLYELAATVPSDLLIVEIGAFKGKSSCYLGAGAQGGLGAKVVSIDPWDLPGNINGKHNFNQPEVLETWKAQVALCGLENQVTPLRTFSYSAARNWTQKIGMLFIDGGHTYNEVKNDYQAFIRWLVPGGILVFDDYEGRNHGVKRFVEELRQGNDLMQWDFSTPPAAVCRRRDVTPNLSLSVAIMAHPKRERHIPYLLEKLGGRATVVWDEHNNRWDTGRRSQLAFAEGATHHLVIQDDAIVSDHFLEAVEKAISYVPDNPISFYTGKVRPSADLVTRMVQKAHRQEVSWISMPGPWWGVAIVTPTNLIPKMIEWCDAHPNIANYDLRMSKYYETLPLKTYYSVPSLVSHRVGPDEPSLVPGRGSGPTRVAHAFVGENGDAREVKWTFESVSP